MHRSFRLASFVVVSSLVVFGGSAGCGSAAEEQESSNPPPSEPTVFDASKETKDDLGIVKWGFATDEAGESRYRGYGARDEVLAEVVQKTDEIDDSHVVFTMTASGTLGAAREVIEFEIRPVEGGTDAEVQMLVKENTFVEGEAPAKVLARFKADGQAYVSDDLGASSSLLEGSGDQLVDRCQQLASRCNRLLIRDEIAAAGASSECGLLKRLGVPLVGGLIGAGAGALAGAGVGAVPGAAIGVVSGMGTQELLCFDARRGAAQARRDFQQCQNEQRQAGCQVTR